MNKKRNQNIKLWELTVLVTLSLSKVLAEINFKTSFCLKPWNTSYEEIESIRCKNSKNKEELLLFLYLKKLYANCIELDLFLQNLANFFGYNLVYCLFPEISWLLLPI